MGAIQQVLLAGKSGNDPFFSSVSLLLHGDGTNGSTTITDSSGTPKTVTVAGATQISTSGPLFGTGSVSIGNGTAGSYMQAPSQAFGTGDFTLEFWGFLNNFASGPTFIDNRVVTPSADFVIYNSAGSFMSFFAAGSIRATSASISLGSWIHYAVCRASGVTRFFMAGVQQGSNYTDSNNYNHTTLRFGANLTGANSMNGNIDDARVTLGVARYTSNFTPPTAAFPNS